VIKALYHRVKRDYIARKYGYDTESNEGALGGMLHLFPLKRREVEAQVRTLFAHPGGKILDVGCGTGEWLSFMRDLGWAVEGVEFDAAAADVAKQRGITVRCGSLRQQNLPAASYDAITLNHVIEHVPDPIETLSECRRLLKPGGRLVISTPNSASLSHRIFGPNWRGLEPPRHLHVFSMDCLRNALEKAGFKTVRLIPEVASSVIYESVLLRRGGTGDPAAAHRNLPARAIAWLFNRLELLLIGSKPFVADCMTAVATNS
jgi:SAM-dependent methyltransferase